MGEGKVVDIISGIVNVKILLPSNFAIKAGYLSKHCLVSDKSSSSQTAWMAF
jgi:hypothetical protein